MCYFYCEENLALFVLLYICNLFIYIKTNSFLKKIIQAFKEFHPFCFLFFFSRGAVFVKSKKIIYFCLQSFYLPVSL